MKLKKLIFTGLMIAIGIVLSNVLSISYPPGTTFIRFGFGYIPIIVVSLLFGPGYGFGAAVAQDLLGFFLVGYMHGPFHPGFTLNAALYGIVPGLMFRYRRSKNKIRICAWVNTFLSAGMLAAAVYYLINIDLISDDSDFSMPLRYVFMGFAVLSGLALFGYSLYHQIKQRETDHDIVFFFVLILYAITSLVLTPLWVRQLYDIPFWPQLPLRVVKMPVEVLVYTALLTRVIKVFWGRDDGLFDFKS
jgi:ECF transporter S component (folate family)